MLQLRVQPVLEVLKVCSSLWVVLQAANFRHVRELQLYELSAHGTEGVRGRLVKARVAVLLTVIVKDNIHGLHAWQA
jgi:hypothetical protein